MAKLLEPDSTQGPATAVDPDTDEGDDEELPSRPDWMRRGETIGRYVVHKCLGVGGMGIIYAAWDPQLDRKLAIKLVRAREGKVGSTRGRARLLREAQALARLRHPNVITVHDFGTHAGRVFVAMEHVEGETLQRVLGRSPRPGVARIVDLFLQVGRGLAAAHRAGLVHRDVKPENVMIGADGRVLVLDFGIAREGLDDDEGELAPTTELDPALAELPNEAEPDPTALVELTKAGAVIGTPAYMSPEQHRCQRLDARSDQFAYCVAMWEAFNGERPFGEGSRQKLLARMRLGQLRPFRNREVPRRIVHALRRGLAWKPSDRFASMELLLEALNPRGRSARRKLWQGVAIGAAIGLALGVAGTALWFWDFGREPSPSSTAVDCEDAAGASP